ncbi:MAG: hypothetical protein LBK13_13120 [Spirochaetales bacterium]|jgi:hypothetical protein|nr:hypothetical protein [Spirochaetales bacterium]
MKKFKYSIIASFIAALALFVVSCSTGGDDDDYTPPIPIASAEQLQKIGVDYPLNGKYELTDNITLTNWMPIGAVQSTAFSGEFDGKGKSITLNGFDPAAYNKTVMISGDDWSAIMAPLGVFWHSSNAEIKNFDLELNIGTGGALALTSTAEFFAVSGVVGYAEQTTVRDISLSGTLIVSRASGGMVVGGIAGLIYKSEISGCASSVTLTAAATAGGVSAGGISAVCLDNPAGKQAITNCSVTGNVSSTGTDEGDTGGIVGQLNGSVEKCSMTGNVSAIASGTQGRIRAGGIAGIFGDVSSGSITNSYATGTVSANSANARARAGGISGDIYCVNGGALVVSSCYATGNVSATGSNESGVGGVIGNVSIDEDNGGGTVTLQACAALNQQVSISGSYTSIGRVVGYAYDASLTNNIADKNMSGTWTDKGPTGKDGADQTLPANQTVFQSTLGWDFSTVWEMDSNYPVLQGQP